MDFAILRRFFYSQFLVTPPYPSPSTAPYYDCTGKTIIVTGANAGLGKEAARHFVRLGAEKVILAVRSVEKGQAAKQDIEESENRPGVVEVWSLDLLSYESVKEFAKKAEGLKRLDSIVENAGIIDYDFKLVEGNEATITTNVVSTFLLAFLVLPKLKETAQKFNVKPNLTIVSSEVHFLTTIAAERAAAGPAGLFAALNDKSVANMNDRYNVSKLLEVFTVREVCATRAKDPYPVTINYLNPGLCHSELMREAGLGGYIFKLLFARTTEVGSRTLVHAGLAPHDTHGQYLADSHIDPPSKFVRSDEGAQVQRQVWEELSRKLEEIEPGVLRNI
ncbi:hypothetical protein LTR04_003493 [Oleoguttula sp. CCFEE 6159]|nr:hypothetical protein LTR04_003493 [Oleoguttula sp. CCFEE 6159]